MALFSLTYDLIKTKDYNKLNEGIDKIPGSKTKPTESQWLLDTNWSSEEIREHIRGFVDKDDKILVIKLVQPPFWATWNIKKDSTDWLHARGTK